MTSNNTPGERKAVTPTRVIPAGQTMPRPPARPEPQTAPPPPPPAPPSKPPAPPPDPPSWDWGPPPTPGPVEVHHTHTVEVVLVPAEEEPPPRWDFGWLRAWLRPWQTLIAAAIALIPSPAYGHSLTTAWAAVLNGERDNGLGTPYLLAGSLLGLALLLDLKRRAWWCRTLLVVALVGGTGALGWYDPITWITGVHR